MARIRRHRAQYRQEPVSVAPQAPLHLQAAVLQVSANVQEVSRVPMEGCAQSVMRARTRPTLARQVVPAVPPASSRHREQAHASAVRRDLPLLQTVRV